MPELVLLLIGEWHEDESGADPDFQACRAAPNLVWLGRRSDEEAARLIALRRRRHRPVRAQPRSTTPRLPLPHPQVRAARAPHDLARPGRASRTWERAVTFADRREEWVAGAARQRRRARAARPRAARVGAGPDRARARTGRCGSGWRRWGSRVGAGLERVTQRDTRSERACRATRREARGRGGSTVGDVPRRSRSGAGPSGRARNPDAVRCAAAPSGRRPRARRVEVPARVGHQPVGRERQRAAAHRRRATCGSSSSATGCRAWRG